MKRVPEPHSSLRLTQTTKKFSGIACTKRMSLFWKYIHLISREGDGLAATCDRLRNIKLERCCTMIKLKCKDLALILLATIARMHELIRIAPAYCWPDERLAKADICVQAKCSAHVAPYFEGSCSPLISARLTLRFRRTAGPFRNHSLLPSAVKRHPSPNRFLRARTTETERQRPLGPPTCVESLLGPPTTARSRTTSCISHVNKEKKAS